MERKGSILSGALLLTAANILLRLISIGFQVFLSARIGAGGLGLLQLISTIGVFAMLAGTSGTRVAAMYLTAEEFGHRRLSGVKASVRVCLRWGAAISSAAGIVLFLLSGPIAGHWLHDSRAALSLKVMGAFLPFSCLCGIMTGYFTACARIRQLVVIEIAERLVSMLITVLLLLTWARTDLRRACCAITFGSSAGCVFDFLLLYAIFRRDMRAVAPPREKLHLPQRLFRLCVPLALNDYLRAGLNTAEQLLIPYGLSRYGGSAELGLAAYGTIHGMAFPILMFPAALLYSVSDLLVPELSRSRAMQRSLRIVDLTDKCVRMGFLFAAAVSGFFFVTAPEMGKLVYDSSESGKFLRIFSPMLLLLYLDAIVDGLLKGLAEQVSCVRYNTFTSVLDVLFLWVLLPRWGIRAYVFTFAVTHAVNLWLSLRRLLLVARHQMQAGTFVRTLIAYFFALFIALLLPPCGSALASILLRGGFYLLLLCAAFVLTQAFTARDYRWLRRVLHSGRKNAAQRS